MSNVGFRDDQILYSVTTDDTLRVYLSIPDASNYLTLYASWSIFSSEAMSFSEDFEVLGYSKIFWIDKYALPDDSTEILQTSRLAPYNKLHDENIEGRKVSPTYFVRILKDGFLVMNRIVVSIFNNAMHCCSIYNITRAFIVILQLFSKNINCLKYF